MIQSIDFLIKKATKLALGVKEEQRQQQPLPPPPLPPPSAVPVPTPTNSVQAPPLTAADDETDMRKRSDFVNITALFFPFVVVEAILDNEDFCNFVEYMMSSSKTTQDPMLPLCN